MYSLPFCNCYQVSKPNIGETRPSQVRADVTINLNMRDIVKAEWEGKVTFNSLSILQPFFEQNSRLKSKICVIFCISALRKHDVVFLVTVRPTQKGPVKYDRTKPFREQVILG